MRNTRRSFALALLVGAVGFTANWGAACKPAPPTSDVIFEGTATESALVSLLDAPVQTDVAQAASFTWTSSGTTFSASQPLTLCWTSGATARAEPFDLQHVGHPNETPPTPERLGFLGALFSASSAYANGSPLTGRGYLLVLSTSANAKLVRVFTTNHDYSPDATVMKKLAAAGTPITAVVTTAYFTGDSLTTMGGPFKGNPVTFTMTP
jgi:hypothetical protein